MTIGPGLAGTTPDAAEHPGAGPASAFGWLSFFLAVLRAKPRFALGYVIVLMIVLPLGVGGLLRWVTRPLTSRLYPRS